MPNKKLYQMGSMPTGAQVFSIMRYMMQYQADQMSGLSTVYEDNDIAMVAWCTGFSYALALMEDNGIPLDLDEALHNWQEQYLTYDINEAIRAWRRKQ